jgi:transcriptional regulator with XRE-family HTH domain
VNIGEKIKNIRKDRDISQNELAHAIGISRSSLSLIESGKRKVSVEELQTLAKYLKLPISELVEENTGTNESTSKKMGLLGLYQEYKKQFSPQVNKPKQASNPLDKYLGDVNPYYYNSDETIVRYE